MMQRRIAGELPAEWHQARATILERCASERAGVATRKASQNVIAALAPHLPELIGGSADLTGSNLTAWPNSRSAGDAADGNYLHYGVREFGMAAIMNGIALHGGLLPFGGTFLVFSDYARSAIRMAALIGVRSIFVLTHDSIGLGEDGPTHQPIEHAAALRLHSESRRLAPMRCAGNGHSMVRGARASRRSERAAAVATEPATAAASC
jgi:transketolase